jgi:hypothetical protein
MHPPSNALDYREIGRAEWDHAVASKNLYDVLDDERPSEPKCSRV